MPRAFLVKKANVSPGKRNWSELPDHERGDVYIPGESTAVMSHFCCCLKRKRNVGDSVYGLVVFGRLYARICGFLLFVCLFARFGIQRVYRCDRWRGKGCPAVIVTGPRNNGKQQRPAVLGESSSCFVGCQSCALLTLDNLLC